MGKSGLPVIGDTTTVPQAGGVAGHRRRTAVRDRERLRAATVDGPGSDRRAAVSQGF
ncbi:MAG: hypothetical protein RIQ53_61 [Pseudomonadota bacterium]|jgi:hypothetical protein